MKFWRISLLTTLTFIAVSLSVVYTSCTDDTCTKVKCRNGGSCVDGYCKCPTGWEGEECQTKMTDRYTGFYDGTVIYDGNPPTIDSVQISYNPTTTDTVSTKTLRFQRFGRPDDIILFQIGADGNVMTYTDDKYGGRTITLIEENDQINFNSVEKPNGKEQTVKFVGTRRKQ